MQRSSSDTADIAWEMLLSIRGFGRWSLCECICACEWGLECACWLWPALFALRAEAALFLTCEYFAGILEGVGGRQKNHSRTFW